MIETKDIDRLLTELLLRLIATGSEDPIQVWADENELPNETLEKLTDDLVAITFSETARSPGKEGAYAAFLRNLSATLLMSFIMGWEASKQYGKPSTNM